MGCAVISDKIGIILNMGLSGSALAGPLTRSALQNPDISRVQLAALLRRRAENAASDQTRKIFWSAFMATQSASPANGNTQKTA